MTREPARPGGCLGAACLPAGDTSDPWGQSLRRSRNPRGGLGPRSSVRVTATALLRRPQRVPLPVPPW